MLNELRKIARESWDLDDPEDCLDLADALRSLAARLIEHADGIDCPCHSPRTD
jgi:hypothetical protein